MSDLPVISLAAFDRVESTPREARRLYDTCERRGFFYLADHGVEPALVDAALRASRRFFSLPEPVKRQYGHDVQKVSPKTSRGFVPMYGETLYPSAGADRKELFDLGFERPESDVPFTGPTVIPDDRVAPGFADAHYALQAQVMSRVTPRLVRALALALGREATWFDRYFTAPILIQRVIHYPSSYSSAGKHTDNGFFTVLIQEQHPSPSLRVYSQGQWMDVACREGTFVINIGDILQHWTNGLFVSTPHEVQHRLATSRLSIPFFVYPDIDAVFTPFGSHRSISVRQIMLDNFESIWETGQGAGRARELT